MRQTQTQPTKTDEPKPNKTNGDDKQDPDQLDSRDARVRSNLMSHLNASIARVEAAEKRVNDAKANLGTAERELVDARDNYINYYEQLHKHLPSRDR